MKKFIETQAGLACHKLNSNQSTGYNAYTLGSLHREFLCQIIPLYIGGTSATKHLIYFEDQSALIFENGLAVELVRDKE